MVAACSWLTVRRGSNPGSGSNLTQSQNVQGQGAPDRFRGKPVSKAHRLLCHSTQGSRVIKKKRHLCGGHGAIVADGAHLVPHSQR